MENILSETRQLQTQLKSYEDKLKPRNSSSLPGLVAERIVLKSKREASLYGLNQVITDESIRGIVERR